MNKLTSNNKVDGTSTLSASEWNESVSKINEIIDAVDNIDTSASGNSVITVEQDSVDTDKRVITVDGVFVGELTDKGAKGVNVNLSGNNNINIEPRPAIGTGEGKNNATDANRKGGNIALKPGDDIELWAHKRGTSKNDEVSIKILTEVTKTSDPTKTDEVPAKLQLNTNDIVLTSKDKVDDSDVMNITVNKALNTRGYLKVRAQAIDLRSESHGGIALQPKGSDGTSSTFENTLNHGSSGDSEEVSSSVTVYFTSQPTFNTSYTYKLTYDASLRTSSGQNPSNVIKMTCYDSNDTAITGLVDVEITIGTMDDPGYYTFTSEQISTIINNGSGLGKIVLENTVTNDGGNLSYYNIDNMASSVNFVVSGTHTNLNKIKFEHGGGDGLEFGTFNTEKTSIYTEEYRFNKNGKILLATRTKQARDLNDSKRDASDETTWYTYQKQADDFYDIISNSDPKNVTWGDLVSFVAWAKTNSFGPWSNA